MQEKVINGDAATCLPKLPYSGLSRFGSSFLSKLLGVNLSNVCKFQLLVEAENNRKHLEYTENPCKTKMVQKGRLGTSKVPFSSGWLVSIQP